LVDTILAIILPYLLGLPIRLVWSIITFIFLIFLLLPTLHRLGRAFVPK